MKQLVIFPVGSLQPKDKERMSKDGFLAIECNDPSKVVMPLPTTALLQADDVLLSVLNAIDGQFNSEVRNKFALNLITKIKANAAKKEAAEK